jgi:hypothetical protein
VALFEPIFDALGRADVRYVVVGGVAVVHGHARLTADLDLAVDLAPEQALRAIETLVELGLRPAAPLDPAEFADRQPSMCSHSGLRRRLTSSIRGDRSTSVSEKCAFMCDALLPPPEPSSSTSRASPWTDSKISRV